MAKQNPRDKSERICKSAVKTGANPILRGPKRQVSKSAVPCELKIVLMQHKTRRDKVGKLVRVMNEVYAEDGADDGLTQPNDDATASLADKPNNAFFQYRTDPEVRNRHHNKPGLLQQSQIVQDIATEWNLLSDELKLPYERKASLAAYEYKKRIQQSKRAEVASRTSVPAKDRTNTAAGRTAQDRVLEPYQEENYSQQEMPGGVFTQPMPMPASSLYTLPQRGYVSYDLSPCEANFDVYGFDPANSLEWATNSFPNLQPFTQCGSAANMYALSNPHNMQTFLSDMNF